MTTRSRIGPPRSGLRAGIALSLLLGLVPILATAAPALAGSVGAAPVAAQPTNVNTTTTLVASPPSPSSFGQPVTFTATVAPVAPATGTPTGSVTFVVDGVQVATSTLVSGGASYSTSLLGAGGHTIVATYSGDANFNQSSATLTYTVGCGTTITGPHTGTIIVTGAVCLNNAQVTGGIIVQAGGSIDMENSTTTGPVSATNSGAIRICGSTIGGSVSVHGATGPVMIGDPTDGGCAVNTIKGSLTLQNNTGGTEALGNNVSGAIVASGNSSPVEIGGHAPPVAVNDNYSVVENQTLTVPPPGVLANDSAPSGGTLTASVVTPPAHAAAFTLNADGSFNYTPAADFHGIDTFTYRTFDGVAFSDPATVIITVIPQATITAVKTEPSPGAGSTVTSGQAAPITYQVAVTNSGGTSSAQVVVTDAVPTGTTYVASSASCGATPNCSVAVASGTITWTLTSVAATTTVNLTFQATVNANDANGATLSNQASFTNIHTPGCTTAACATNTVTNPVVTPASISVTKSEPTPGAGTTVTSGQATPIAFQLTVANSGGTASGPVTVTDAIPVGTTYVASSATCGTTPNCTVGFSAGSVTWTITSVAALSGPRNLGFQVTVNAGDANNSTISNQASFTNVMTPGCATATCTTNAVTNPVVTPASLTVTKTEPTPGAGATVIAGQATPITYGLAVANSGGTASGPVTITDAVPTGTTYVASSATCGTTPNCTVGFSAGTVTWTITSAAPLSTNNLSFQVSVNANDANNSTISNSASFTNVNTPSCATATCTTNTVTNPVLSVPAITVTKSEPSPGAGVTVTAGQASAITYQLAVANNGGTASGSVTVTDAVPAGTTYVAASATCGTTPNCTVGFSAGTVTWTITSAAALSTNNLSFQVTVNANDVNGSTISNSASYTNVNTPSCATATCATNIVTNPVVTAASITVSKSEPTPGSGVTVTAGQAAAITYQLAVTNSGGTASGAVTVTDAVPAGTTYVAASATCGTTPICSAAFSAGTVTWTITSVAPFSTNNLSFQVSVNGNDVNGSTIANQGSFTNVNTPSCATATCATNTVSNPVVVAPVITVTKAEPTPGANMIVAAGQATAITYQLTIANSGGTASGVVTVNDNIPAGTTYVANSVSCATTLNCTVGSGAGSVGWTITSVAANTSGTLSFQVTVNATAVDGSTIANQATFDNVNTPSCSTATCTTNTVSNPVVAPIVNVSKSEPTPGANTTVTAGQAAAITYQLAVVNSGGAPSGAVTVTDTVPTGTTYVGSSATCGATPNCTPSFSSGTVTWNITSVAPNSTNNVSFQVTVNASDADGSSISNQGSFTNVNTPSCATPTCLTNAVVNPVVAPVINLTKAEPTPGANTTVTAGQAAPITYQLTVGNTGAGASRTVTVTDAIPTGTTYVAASASCGTTPNCTVNVALGTVTWTITSVAALSGPFNLGFQVTVDAADANGSTIANTASFTDVNTPACGNASTCLTNTVSNPVITPASVTVTKSGPSGNVTATVTTITYQLSVVNSGGTASGPVTVTDTIPAGTTYVGSSVSCGTTPNCTPTFASGTVTWTRTSVAALSGPQNLSFKVTVDAADVEGSTVDNSATFTNVNTPGCATSTCPTNTVSNMVVIPPPTVIAQSFSGAVGNTTFGVGTTPDQPSVIISGNLLTGDSDPTGHTLTASGPSTTTQGGLLTVNANGTFTYNPPAGFTGNDTFSYTVSNGFHSASNTATVTVAGMVWYVNSAVLGNGDGRSISPFNVLSSVEPVAGTGDYIFLNGQGAPPNYTGGITLKASQTLLSTSVGLVVSGHTIYTAAGPNPTITNTAPNPGITLAEGNTVSGIAVNATSGPGILANGKNSTTITSSSITTSGGNGLDVTGGNGTFGVGAPITTSGGHSVSVTNRTGGNLVLSGAINDTGTGVVLANNGGATSCGGACISFTGGVVVASGASTAFSASNSGTVTVTGTNNTLTTTTGTALNVINTNIGASGLAFKSITAGTAASGPASGIILNNTGLTAGLTVTGDSTTANSGGVIQHTTGPGIQLTSTTGVSLSWMNIHDTGGSGIRAGSGHGPGDVPGMVKDFFLDHSTISNSDTAGTTTDDSNIGFNTTGVGNEQNVIGDVTITNNTLTNALYHGIDIFNYNGVITHMNISNNTITSSTSTASSKGSGILVAAFGNASTVASITKATIDSNHVTNFPSAPALQVQGGDANSASAPAGTVGVAGDATNIIAITNNIIAGASAANPIGGEGLIALVNGKGQGNFNISSNNISNTKGIGISSSSFGFANVTETINNNTIVAHNGFGAQGIGVGTSFAFSSADTPSLTTTITNNNISATDGDGILAVARDATGTLKAKIQNNTVAAPLSGVRQGIRVDAGNAGSVNDTVCLNISGNTSAESSPGALGIGLRKQATNVFGVNGMAATATPGVESYVNGLNPAGGGTLLISATTGFTNCSLP